MEDLSLIFDVNFCKAIPLPLSLPILVKALFHSSKKLAWSQTDKRTHKSKREKQGEMYFSPGKFPPKKDKRDLVLSGLNLRDEEEFFCWLVIRESGFLSFHDSGSREENAWKRDGLRGKMRNHEMTMLVIYLHISRAVLLPSQEIDTVGRLWLKKLKHILKITKNSTWSQFKAALKLKIPLFRRFSENIFQIQLCWTRKKSLFWSTFWQEREAF